MSWMIILAVVIAALMLVALIFVLLPALLMRSLGPALQERIGEVYQPQQVLYQDLKALTFGLQSKGVFQARGNGALVLTARELHFFQFTPRRDIRIPRDAITEIKVVRSHLGKTIGRKLLYVGFTLDGQADSMAWYVTDVQTWIAKLG